MRDVLRLAGAASLHPHAQLPPLRPSRADAADLSRYGQVVASEGSRHTLRVPKAETPQVTARLLGDLPIADLTVEDHPIEDVIEQVFAGALDTAGSPSPD